MRVGDLLRMCFFDVMGAGKAGAGAVLYTLRRGDEYASDVCRTPSRHEIVSFRHLTMLIR